MKKEKIFSLILMILFCVGMGYGIYRNTGKVAHEILLLRGETVRVGNMTQQKVSQQFKKHELTISGNQDYSVFLEGRFPDPAKRIHAKNEYALKIIDSRGELLFDEIVEIRFTNKDKKEGLSQVIDTFFPGKTSVKVTDLVGITEVSELRLEFSRLGGDTVANELFLRIREKRG